MANANGSEFILSMMPIANSGLLTESHNYSYTVAIRTYICITTFTAYFQIFTYFISYLHTCTYVCSYSIIYAHHMSYTAYAL